MLPVSYLGGRKGTSKPRWISVGLMLMGLGSLIWTIPHFFAPIYNIQQQKIGENSKNGGSSLCQPGKIITYVYFINNNNIFKFKLQKINK